MMRVLLFETVTGDPVRDLQRSAWSGDTGILNSDKATATIPAYTPTARTLNLKDLLIPYKRSIALIDESVQGVKTVLAAGMLTKPKPVFDGAGRLSYDLIGRGIEKILDYRHVRLPGWPLVNAEGKPIAARDVVLDGLSYGTIIKRLVQGAESHPGGGLPIVYEPDRAGVHERNEWLAVDGRKVLEALDGIADLEDGVEYDFQPQIDELDRITYRLVTGTDTERIISGPTERLWNLGGKNPDIRAYDRDPDAGPPITDAIFAGGKDGDKVVLARAQDHSWIADGYPMAEVWDSSHSSVSRETTLQSWAAASLGVSPDRVSFEVKAKYAHGLRHGDWATIAAQGHPDLPNGDYRVRVLSIKRTSADPHWVSLQFI